MAFDRIEQGADQVRLVDERTHPRRFVDRDDLEFIPRYRPRARAIFSQSRNRRARRDGRLRGGQRETQGNERRGADPTIAKPTKPAANPAWHATIVSPAQRWRTEAASAIDRGRLSQPFALTRNPAWQAKQNVEPRPASPANAARCGASRRSSNADQILWRSCRRSIRRP